MIHKEFNIFLNALMFFTRIPVYKFTDHSNANLNQSSRYFPVVGWIVGGACALTYYIGILLSVPPTISVVISTAIGILITGAFHEDGFADVCDGFGGGWEKMKILEIMKDSRTGAYGVVGITLMLITKILLLSEINVLLAPFAIIVGHSISRLGSASYLYTMDYVREDETSKSKPLAKAMSHFGLIQALILGVIPFLLLPSYYFLLTIIPIIIAQIWLGRYYRKWIGGYTGDCLGAAQQVFEVIFYLGIIIIQNNLL